MNFYSSKLVIDSLLVGDYINDDVVNKLTAEREHS